MTSLSTKLAELEAAGKPIQVGIIGAGKFGSTYISQSHRNKGVRLAAIADLSPERALSALRRTGFPEHKYDPTNSISLEEGLRQGNGSTAAGVCHVLLCYEHKKHIVMVKVEADVLAGLLLTREAKEAGIIYSMAYGDQPALIAEMIDWAQTTVFDVVCAGEGKKYLPQYHESTPDTVSNHYGSTKEQLVTGDFNPQMSNSFLDGTKSALEMAAVANECDLGSPSDGLKFPPCGAYDLPRVLRPKEDGGQPQKKGMVGVVSCLEMDGRWVFNYLRWGVYVVIEAPGDYQRDFFKQYGLKTDPTGKYTAQYKRYHLIGLELGISIATITVRGEPTADLKASEKLDGEGGFMAYGKLMTAEDSLAIEGLPIGLAHSIVPKNDIKKGHNLSWADVEYTDSPRPLQLGEKWRLPTGRDLRWLER
ncbi:SAF domain-containing protein [Zopfia rhizophila CBS 207.26]|uniref:SAF domain-containing protein n=1 Tax=Zopfia rhizophila CBS 207.26 TaxID=1314779 RepID=A0A6A6E2N4_9PEZI|nr:SAF domain-containing protein [Zopfia rhizophila CBS 207.26]